MPRPQPKYGWWGQTASYRRFPIGSRVKHKHGPGRIGEVIDLGEVPSFLRHITDLVRLRMVENTYDPGTFSVGSEEYWNGWQLEIIDE